MFLNANAISFTDFTSEGVNGVLQTRSSKSPVIANKSSLKIVSFVERKAIDKMTAGSRRKRRKLTPTKPILLKRKSKKYVLWF